MEEYTRSMTIQEYVPSNPRHRVFHVLKYGDTKTYKGAWGPELLHWNANDELGYVWTTLLRSLEIRDWIRDNIFV